MTRAKANTRAKAAISTRLNWASVALANAAGDPGIAVPLAGYGFNDARIAEGHKLFERAGAAVTAQVAATGEYRAAVARAGQAAEAARHAYQGLAQAARVEFKREKESLATLGLNRRMPPTVASFVTMALALFDNTAGTPAIAERLTRFGYTPERLAAERGRIEALIAARRAQEAAKGAAQNATAEQDKAMTALDDEMAALRKMAKLALKAQPQLLEKLGILQRSAGAPAKRRPGQKGADTRKSRRQQADSPAGAK